MLIILIDCVDLLLRFNSSVYSSRVYRFVRPSQGTTGLVPQEQTRLEQLWRTTRNRRIDPTSANVHFCSVERFRNLISSIRIRRQPGQPHFVTATLRYPKRPNEYTTDQRPARRGWPANRISVSRQGHLLI